MPLVINIILIVLFSLFPLFLWGYGSTVLSAHEWNRTRFFYGILSGLLSVGGVYFLRSYLLQADNIRILTFLGILLSISITSLVATWYGSIYVRVFLQKVVLLHGGLFLSGYILFEGVRYIMPPEYISLSLISSLLGVIFAAMLEEGVKHISSIGLTAREFRFTRRDLLIFAFFITLGFVFFENLLYFILSIHANPGTLFFMGMTRSTLSLLAHLLSVSIGIIFWWKALSYGVFSLRYSVFCMVGFFGATLSHALFNILIQSGSVIGVMIFGIVSYILWTRWMTPAL